MTETPGPTDPRRRRQGETIKAWRARTAPLYDDPRYYTPVYGETVDGETTVYYVPTREVDR